MKLSVLDQSPVREGVTPRDALFETIDLARHADGLGFCRYWLAEHHGSPGLAGSAPEIMVALVAAETRHLRVGSGGVMLSHYSSLKVAEQFRMLETLYPGRIDLGIGRAPGSDQLTAIALQHGPGALGIEHFPNQIADLLAFLENTMPADHPFSRIRVAPAGDTNPEIWLLGSSDQSALYAAYFSLPFSFAHFITDEAGREIMEGYRRHFRPSTRLPAPQGSIGVFVMCAEEEAEARRLAASRDLWRLRQRRGILAPFPPPEDALAYSYSDAELREVEYHRRRQIVGTPDQVKAEITALALSYGVDEIVVLTICHDFAARKRSYSLLALLRPHRRSLRAGAAGRHVTIAPGGDTPKYGNRPSDRVADDRHARPGFAPFHGSGRRKPASPRRSSPSRRIAREAAGECLSRLSSRVLRGRRGGNEPGFRNRYGPARRTLGAPHCARAAHRGSFRRAGRAPFRAGPALGGAGLSRCHYRGIRRARRRSFEPRHL